jgi:hypothetical protein
VLTLSEPNPRCSDGDERLVATVEFIVAGGNSAEVLDPTEEALNEVAPFVDVPVKVARVGPVGSRRNDHFCTTGRDGVDQGLRIIGLVGGNGVGCHTLKQRLGLGHVGRLSGCEAPPSEVAEGFDQGMNLRCQPATRPANRLGALFFWAPAAC